MFKCDHILSNLIITKRVS